MNKGFFITGSGTEVGKTYVTALIIKALRQKNINAGYFKAALSGDVHDENDASYVKRIAALPENIEFFVPYIFKTPVSPHLASRIEEKPIEMGVIRKTFTKVSEKYDIVIAEGSGGILCPLRWNEEKILLEDVIKLTDFPLIIVGNSIVGAINAIVLTVEYAKSRKLKIAGIILNNFEKNNIVHEDNRNIIEELTDIPVIATVAKNDETINIEMLK